MARRRHSRFLSDAIGSTLFFISCLVIANSPRVVSRLKEWLSPYPTREQRIQNLRRPEVLNEAISRYRRATKPPEGTDSN
ncbi:hypothetical protein ACS0TY_009551 [Phlomoides rotata]